MSTVPLQPCTATLLPPPRLRGGRCFPVPELSPLRLGFGFGARVWCLEVGVQGSVFEVWDFGIGVWDLEFGVWGLGLEK